MLLILQFYNKQQSSIVLCDLGQVSLFLMKFQNWEVQVGHFTGTFHFPTVRGYEALSLKQNFQLRSSLITFHHYPVKIPSQLPVLLWWHQGRTGAVYQKNFIITSNWLKENESKRREGGRQTKQDRERLLGTIINRDDNKNCSSFFSLPSLPLSG